MSLPFGHFLTTNYDRILEVAHEKNSTEEYCEVDLDDPQRSGKLFDVICSRNAQRHFIHAHGSIRNPQGMVLALEDYNRCYVNRNDFIQAMGCILTRRIVFIGFSLSDEEFMGPLKFLTGCFGVGEPRHFAILPEPLSSGAIEAQRTTYRSKYQIEPVFYDPRDKHSALEPFMEELVADVNNHQLKVIKEKIAILRDPVSENTGFGEELRALQDIERVAGVTISANCSGAVSAVNDKPTELDTEIDSIFSYVKDGRPEIAIQMYKAVLKREGNGLSKRLKYRLHANIGNALCSMSKDKEAAEEYCVATKYWEETKDSKALRALAHILRGEHSEAYEIAKEICEEHPDYPRGHALRLQALPEGYSFRDARKSVPLKLRRDVEVAYALSRIAGDEGLSKRQETYGRIAWSNSDEWTEGGLSYAATILNSEKESATICGGTSVIPLNPERVREAESILTTVLDKLKERDPRRIKGGAFYNRAMARP